MANYAITKFTDSKIWQEAHRLSLEIFKVTKVYPEDREHSLAGSMRKNSIAITNSIAEAYNKEVREEQLKYYFLAKSSIIKLVDNILLSKDLNFLGDTLYDLVMKEAELTKNLINEQITILTT